MPQRWDIFCTVVDNYGDIGVCWRLTKQLAGRHHKTVRLWVDDLPRFACIEPAINPALLCQNVYGIEIYRWQIEWNAVEPADVVIEAFACELPDAYVQAMRQRERQPVWINLEYLSAEAWVCRYHGLPSPHPRFPLTKTFFFPGFTPETGGLLREYNLLQQRNSWDATAEQNFFQQKHLSRCDSGVLRISLFGYDTAPVQCVTDLLAESTLPVVLIVPAGSLANQIGARFNYPLPVTNVLIEHGSLTIQIIPFLTQDEYDRLLWSCDLNFVRGEDSFVRAQWAGKPFIWNIYPQSEGVHWKKLAAFLDLYTEKMPAKVAESVRDMWLGWNGKIGLNASIWKRFLDLRVFLLQHNQDWIDQISSHDDLVSSLVRFAGNKL